MDATDFSVSRDDKIDRNRRPLAKVIGDEHVVYARLLRQGVQEKEAENCDCNTSSWPIPSGGDKWRRTIRLSVVFLLLIASYSSIPRLVQYDVSTIPVFSQTTGTATIDERAMLYAYWRFLEHLLGREQTTKR